MLYMAPLYKQIFIGILLGLMSHGVLARPDYGPINWQRSEDFNSNEDVYSDMRKYPDNEPNFLSPWGIVSEDYEEAIHRMGLPARPPIVEVAELMPTPSPLRRVPQPPRNMLPIKERTEKKNSPYMSACHFKICNMGRKRNVRYLRF